MRTAHRCFDDLAHLYDRTRGGDERGRRFAGDLARHLHPGELAFEVGVGTGVVALGLRQLGFPVAGCDISTEMLRRAAERVPGRVLAGDASWLPVRDSCVRNAYSVWVLHLVADPREVLAEVARALSIGGRYVVVGDPIGEEGDTDNPIGAILSQMRTALDARVGKRVRGDDRATLVPSGEAAGFELVHESLTSPDTFEESPVEAAGMLEQRAFSYLDNVTEDAWRDHVVPAIEELRSLPDRPVLRQAARHRIFVFERR